MTEMMVVGCAFCTWSEMVPKGDRAALRSVVVSHVNTCEGHPMRAVEAEVEHLGKLVTELRAEIARRQNATRECADVEA